jgi:hypothetical protein
LFDVFMKMEGGVEDKNLGRPASSGPPPKASLQGLGKCPLEAQIVSLTRGQTTGEKRGKGPPHDMLVTQ